MSTPAEQLTLWADRLRDLCALGLHYCKNIYDRQRYQAVQQVAMELHAFATATPLEQLEPLRAPIFTRPTPLATGDAAIFDREGRILLIRRADNGLWAMPGGALEVGETPAEGVVREAFEETGLHCQALALAGVFDSRLCGTTSRHHLYQFVFICRPLVWENQIPRPSDEALEARWFRQDELPEFSQIDPGHATRIPQVFRVWNGERLAYFD